MNYEDVKPGSLLDMGEESGYLLRYSDGSGWWLFCSPPKTADERDDESGRGWPWEVHGSHTGRVLRDDLSESECDDLALKFQEPIWRDDVLVDREALAAWLVARDGDRDTYAARASKHGATAPDVGDWVLWDDVPVNTMVREDAHREGVATHLANGRGTWTHSYGRDSAPTAGGAWEWRRHCAAGTRALVLARVDTDIDVFKLQEIARVAMASELIADRWAVRVSA